MSEIKKKLNITKINAKNLFLLVLVMLAVAIIGTIAKQTKGSAGKII